MSDSGVNSWPMMKIKNLFPLGILLTFNAYSALLGDVSQVRNLPGYLEVNPNSPIFKGIVHRKNKADNIERRTPSEIFATFFTGEYLDFLKVNIYTNQITGYIDSLYLVECQSELEVTDPTLCDNSKKFQKKWNKNSHHKALNFALHLLSKAELQKNLIRYSEINDIKNADFIEQVFTAIELLEGIKAEDIQMAQFDPIMGRLSQAAIALQKEYITNQEVEATNLLVPENHPSYGKRLFLSPEELVELKNNNFDISLLNPISSGMWRHPTKPISEFDTTNYDQSGLGQINKLYDEATTNKIVNPDEVISVVYKPHRILGGMTPKFEVHYGDHKWKLKFITNRHGNKRVANFGEQAMKMIWGSEVNVEPVVNNLAAALGFTVDPTYYKKKIRVYFEDEVYKKDQFEKAHKEMIEHISSRYAPVTNIPSALEDIKIDENGRKYIEMKSVTLEQKSNEATDMNIGFFDRVGLGKEFMREHRAFYMFMAWVHDIDVKNDNNKLKIVPHEDGFKVMHSNSDMGAALGIGFPNVYNTPFVKTVYRNKNNEVTGIKLHFVRIYPYEIEEAVNINDVKWFARLIGQFSIEQLEKACIAAGMPEVVAKYYALIMAKKRNELLEAVDLIGTNFTNEFGQNIKLEKLPEFNGTIDGFEEYFPNGRLSDPENKLFNAEIENWPRNWGVSIKFYKGSDEPITELRKIIVKSIAELSLKTAHRYILDRGVIGNNGFRFTDARIIDHSLGEICQDDCFVQGFDYGLKNFAPMRFLVANPDADKDYKHPYWLVDMFRIGFFAGDRGELFQKLIGFDVPSTMDLAIGGRIFKVYEIMRVTPVAGLDEYFDHKNNFLTLPRYTFKNLRNQLVDSLEKKESLIVSSYAGLQIQSRIKAMTFPYNIAGIRLSSYVMGLSRMTLTHKKDAIFANWSDQKKYYFDLSANIIDTFVKVPVLKQYWAGDILKDRTYVFKDEGHEREILGQHLSHHIPTEIPQEYALEKRITKTREHGSLATLFGIFGIKRFVKKITTEFEDYKKEEQLFTKKLVIEIERNRMVQFVSATWKKTAEILVNSKEQLALKFKFDMHYPAAKKERVLNLVEANAAYMPQPLFNFDTEYMKHYMGEVDINAELIFTHEMLEKIFSSDWTFETLCPIYGSYMKIEKSHDVCMSPFNLDPNEYQFIKTFKRYYRNFNIAREKYIEVKAAALEARYIKMKKIVSFFVDKDRIHALEFAKALIGKENLLEKANILSNTAAFPGDNDEIKLRNHKDELKEENKLNDFDAEIFSDKIHNALQLYFLDATV
jgi:hypothetical protein